MILQKIGLLKYISLLLLIILQHLSLLNVSKFETIFHTQPHFPVQFQWHVSWNQFRDCTAQYCSGLPPKPQYKFSGLYPLFHRSFWKLFLLGFSQFKQQWRKFAQKFFSTHWKNWSFLALQCKTHLILINHNHWSHLFDIELWRCSVFKGSETTPQCSFQNCKQAYGSHIRTFWHRTEKHFAQIDINWFLFYPNDAFSLHRIIQRTKFCNKLWWFWYIGHDSQ